MTNKIKYLLITGLLLFSSGAMAGVMPVSISFHGEGYSGSVTTSTLPGLPVGTDVLFSLHIGWESGGYQFSLDPLTLSTSAGMFSGSGMLGKLLETGTLAHISGRIGLGDNKTGFEATTTAVPEPQTLALLGIGLLIFGAIRVSRTRNRS